MSSGVVFWRERVERVNEEIRRRPKADQRAQDNKGEVRNCAIEHERQRWKDEQTTKAKECDLEFRTETLEDVTFLIKKDLSLEFWQGDCHFVREFFNFQPAMNSNTQRLNRNSRETDRIHSHSTQEIRQKDRNREQDTYTTRNQDLVAPAPSYIPIELLSVRSRGHQH